MPAEFSYARRVQFAETDMAGVMHFANYFRLMEEAEHGFWRSLGLNVVMRGEGGTGLGPAPQDEHAAAERRHDWSILPGPARRGAGGGVPLTSRNGNRIYSSG
jgi:hypothetical protein